MFVYITGLRRLTRKVHFALITNSACRTNHVIDRKLSDKDPAKYAIGMFGVLRPIEMTTDAKLKCLACSNWPGNLTWRICVHGRVKQNIHQLKLIHQGRLCMTIQGCLGLVSETLQCTLIEQWMNYDMFKGPGSFWTPVSTGNDPGNENL